MMYKLDAEAKSASGISELFQINKTEQKCVKRWKIMFYKRDIRGGNLYEVIV